MGPKIKSGKFKETNGGKDMLFGDEEAERSEETLRVNNDYASKYNSWRSKEELQKLKDKYGDDPEESDSSSSSDSGDETPPNVFGRDFLKTLSCLKSKDPKIYDKNFHFFENEDEIIPKTKSEKGKKSLYLPDYERETLLKYNGELPDEDEDNLEMKMKLESTSQSAYEAEQRQIKESIKKVTESDSEDDLLTLRVKSTQELKKEESDYSEWIKGQKKELEEDSAAQDLKGLREYWSNPALDEDETFLRNFVLDKQYLDRDSQGEIPTYEEITEEPESDAEKRFSDDQETFEHKYNFRFEEPDQEFIKRYPRTLKESMRTKDNRRRDKRLEIRDRKKREKEQKREELKRLKALKRKEIVEKISKIKEITGNTKVGFKDMDLEGDFNPEDHDAKMKSVFDEEYYGDEVGDEQKPVFPPDEDEEEDEKWDEWTGPDSEHPDFNMDCDYQEEPSESTRKSKKRKHKLREALKRKKPIFNPSDETFEEYLDEYYKLDYEDMVGDLPCRFKYRKVIPNDFGLSLDEILIADDRELNKWCSLKKTCQIRTEDEEKYDVKAYARKSKDMDKKKKILRSVYEEEDSGAPDDDSEQVAETAEETVEPKQDTANEPEAKRKRKKRKRNNKTEKQTAAASESKVEPEPSPHRKQKKKKLKTVETEMTDDRLKAYGINPKKYKNKLKYGTQ